MKLVLFINFKGILCIGFLKRARQQKEASREQAIKDLEVIYCPWFKLQFHYVFSPLELVFIHFQVIVSILFPLMVHYITNNIDFCCSWVWHIGFLWRCAFRVRNLLHSSLDVVNIDRIWSEEGKNLNICLSRKGSDNTSITRLSILSVHGLVQFLWWNHICYEALPETHHFQFF